MLRPPIDRSGSPREALWCGFVILVLPFLIAPALCASPKPLGFAETQERAPTTLRQALRRITVLETRLEKAGENLKAIRAQARRLGVAIEASKAAAKRQGATLRAQRALIDYYEKLLDSDQGGDRGGGGGRGGGRDDPDPPPPDHAWVSPVERFDPVRPTDVHAHIYPGRYVMPSGESVQSDYPVADAYEALEPYVDGLVVLGIHGAAGRVAIGTSWSKWDHALLNDDEPVEVAFVGLDDAAEVGPLMLGSGIQDVHRAEFYDLGIRGAPDTFAVRLAGKVDHLVFDGFWILPAPNVELYTSGIYLSRDWETLTLKDYEARGLPFREHCFYLKPGGRTQVLDCELWGGNYTGSQCRSSGPTTDGKHGPSPIPHGEILYEGNFADGFGWNHINPGGGRWITIWSSLENRVAIRGNALTDGRYGGLGVSQGVPSTSPYLTTDNYSHAEVWIEGNEFRTPRSSRSTGGLTAAREIHFAGTNVFQGGPRDLVLNGWWSQKYTEALPVGSIIVHGLTAIPDAEAIEYDMPTDSYHQVDLGAFVVPR